MIKQVHKSLAVHHNSWTLKFDHFTIYHHYSSLSRIAYENRYVTHPLPIFNSYLFNRMKIVPIYAHESSKSISLIKRRIEYLTKDFLLDFQRLCFLISVGKSFTAIWEWLHSWKLGKLSILTRQGLF